MHVAIHDHPLQHHDHMIACVFQDRSISGSYYDSAGKQKWWVSAMAKSQLPDQYWLAAVCSVLGSEEKFEVYLAAAVAGQQESNVIERMHSRQCFSKLSS